MTPAILQATLARGERKRRIPVYRANARYAGPHIPQSFFAAVCANLGGTDGVICEEAFPLLVVGEAGKVVATVGNG